MCIFVVLMRIYIVFLTIAGDMSSRISSREETGDLQAWLDGDHALDDAPEGMPEAAIDPCWRSNMLIQVLLRGGQASPTHTFVYLDRYGGKCCRT